MTALWLALDLGIGFALLAVGPIWVALPVAAALAGDTIMRAARTEA